MEIATRTQESSRRNPSSSSPINSPRSNGSNSNININGVQFHHHTTAAAAVATTTTITPPISPIPPIPRSTEANPYPTTFVQADTTNFKQVVQMLTGSSETAKQASDPSPPPPQPPPTTTTTNNKSSNFVIPPIKTTTPKKQNFKLYERRANNFKNSLMINTLVNNNSNCSNNSSNFSPRNNMPEILSPSLLDFPKLALSSPVTPLNIDDPFNRSSPSLGTSSSSSEEERAIAEKGFYLHPSPISTPRDHEPQLLPLFPLSSPRVSGSSS
ncbi:hypothetical protein Q3G72_009959 [Acer saccharum]|nr:hypothetical protein Q3G72_009959 [Acer saccharum]